MENIGIVKNMFCSVFFLVERAFFERYRGREREVTTLTIADDLLASIGHEFIK